MTTEPEVEVTIGPVSYSMPRSTMCCLAGVLALVGVALGFGLVPFIFGGFASATETKRTFDDRLGIINGLREDLVRGFNAAKQERDTLRQDGVNSQRQVLARIVVSNLKASAMRYCDALRGNRQGEVDAYAIELADLQAEYQSYTSNLYPLRPCQ